MLQLTVKILKMLLVTVEKAQLNVETFILVHTSNALQCKTLALTVILQSAYFVSILS